MEVVLQFDLWDGDVVDFEPIFNIFPHFFVFLSSGCLGAALLGLWFPVLVMQLVIEHFVCFLDLDDVEVQTDRRQHKNDTIKYSHLYDVAGGVWHFP
jgi:hypothetical protein